MRVFIAGASLQPLHSGVAYSVSGLAAALERAGVEVGVWAPDQSAATTPLLPAGSSVQRLSGTANEALDSFPRAHILHDNGIWWPHNHRLAQLARERGIRRVVSTRGMLEPWALNHKRWKKRLAWWLYQRRDLARAHSHHATSEAEAGSVLRLSLGTPVCVIPNGVDVAAPERTTSIVKDEGAPARQKKTALFLGRIYPVKGLPALVAAWARVRPEGWVLQIAGPDEAGHRAEVEKAISTAGLNDVMFFSGPLDAEAKRSAFLNADLFVLPTRSENFGTVIAEAMVHGLPVLTTTAAPWPMLKERGCGWWVDPTIDGLEEGLRRATSLDSMTLRAMGSTGRDLVAAEYGWEGVAKRFIAMYTAVMASGGQHVIHDVGRK